MSIEYNPAQDGITHINLYSRGNTNLGRMLSNFNKNFFVVPGIGSFASMEAFYYYVSSGSRYEFLRKLSGGVAKMEGKRLPVVKLDDFEDVMKQGIQAKYDYNKNAINALILLEGRDSDGGALPLTHYYCNQIYSSVDESYSWKITVPQGNAWLVDKWTEIVTAVIAANPITP